MGLYRKKVALDLAHHCRTTATVVPEIDNNDFCIGDKPKGAGNGGTGLIQITDKTVELYITNITRQDLYSCKCKIPRPHIDQLKGIVDPLPFSPVAGIRQLLREARGIHHAQ